MKRLVFIGLLILLLIVSFPTSAQSGAIGTPCALKGWYARQEWTMTVYDGRLYIGCGNASNLSPSPNSGTIPIWSYTSSGGWVSEAVANVEQINQFTTYNGQLAFAGFDNRGGDWTKANYYTLDAWGWHEQTIPLPTYHDFDNLLYNGKLFTALAQVSDGNSIAYSPDGISWTPQIVPFGATATIDTACSTPGAQWANRVYALFNFAGTLYANTQPFGVCPEDASGYQLDALVKWDGAKFVSVYAWLDYYRLIHSVNYAGQWVTIEASNVNDMQATPRELVAFDTALNPTNLTLSNCARPQDIALSDGALYVLCNQLSGTTWRVGVEKTTDLTTWTEVALSTGMATFARSFALDYGKVYIGLGVDTTASTAAQAASGQVYSLPRTG